MENFSKYQNQKVYVLDDTPAKEDVIYCKDYLLRLNADGYISDGKNENGEDLPAIESKDATHVEHWKDGVLHCEYEPAVIDLLDDYEEWWFNGVLDKKIVKGEIVYE